MGIQPYYKAISAPFAYSIQYDKSLQNNFATVHNII